MTVTVLGGGVIYGNTYPLVGYTRVGYPGTPKYVLVGTLLNTPTYYMELEFFALFSTISTPSYTAFYGSRKLRKK